MGFRFLHSTHHHQAVLSTLGSAMLHQKYTVFQSMQRKQLNQMNERVKLEKTVDTHCKGKEKVSKVIQYD